MIPKKITTDLQKGMGLEETLIKHNTNLQELFKNVKTLPPTKQKDPITYILSRSDGKYTIRKTKRRKNRKKTYFYGTYYSLHDAETIRDELLLNGWKQKSVNSLCRKHGIKRAPSKNDWRYGS